MRDIIFIFLTSLTLQGAKFTSHQGIPSEFNGHPYTTITHTETEGEGRDYITYTCGTCGKTFTNIKSHINQGHKNENQPHKKTETKETLTSPYKRPSTPSTVTPRIWQTICENHLLCFWQGKSLKCSSFPCENLFSTYQQVCTHAQLIHNFDLAAAVTTLSQNQLPLKK